MTKTEIVLHGVSLSGHTHRVGLMLNALGLSYRFEDAPGPVRAGAAFLALNPLGQVPVLQDGGLDPVRQQRHPGLSGPPLCARQRVAAAGASSPPPASSAGCRSPPARSRTARPPPG